jgi:hypothetical protein
MYFVLLVTRCFSVLNHESNALFFVFQNVSRAKTVNMDASQITLIDSCESNDDAHRISLSVANTWRLNRDTAPRSAGCKTIPPSVQCLSVHLLM